MKPPLLLLFFLLSLLHVSTSTPPPQNPPLAILNAAETLSNSGYNAMSLTLQLILSSLDFPRPKATSSHPTLTIFTPPDSSFEASGQPSLSHLLLHFSPLSLSLSSLSSLRFGTRLPSLSPSQTPLFVTTPPDSPQISINNVRVAPSPIFDDGSVIVFAVDDFFDANFTLMDDDGNAGGGDAPLECTDVAGASSFEDAVAKLKARGYSIMASFLELQLLGYLKLGGEVLELTMFAPEDEVLVRFSGDIGSYSGLLMKHLLPCRLSYADLNGVKNGTVFKGGFDGLSTMIERTDKDLFVNGVEVTFPDLYFSDWLVIHGISDAITQQPDDTVGVEEMEEEDVHEEHDHQNSVSGVSYGEEASSPNGNEL